MGIGILEEFIPSILTSSGASQVVLVLKSLPAKAGDVRDPGSILGSGRSPGGGHSNPLQYPCLENPMDRGAWQFTHSTIQLKIFSRHTLMSSKLQEFLTYSQSALHLMKSNILWDSRLAKRKTITGELVLIFFSRCGYIKG